VDKSQSATVVLVHGAGAGAWMWDPMIKELDTRGIKHTEVDLPTSDPNREPTLSFHDDADHLRSVLDQIEGPIVLVGNSYGGVIITEASANQANVVRLVYVAAMMPDGDEEVMNYMMTNCTPEFTAP
jgi:pimeloyl-ACP methyl ester carboxylesterase